jgi:hypothetical protein
MERVCCKETLDIVNTVLSNGAVADVNMDLTEKLSKNYCSSTENQSGNSKRNK